MGWEGQEEGGRLRRALQRKRKRSDGAELVRDMPTAINTNDCRCKVRTRSTSPSQPTCWSTSRRSCHGKSALVSQR